MSLIFSTMPTLRNLRVLIIPDCTGVNDSDSGEEDFNVLSKLHTLRIDECSDICFPLLDCSLMPNLRHLSVYKAAADRNSMAFFDNYGAQLKSLEVSFPDPKISMALVRCPNLEDFIVSLYTYTMYRRRRTMSFFLGHSNVSRVVIRDMPPAVFTFEEYKSSMDTLLTEFTAGTMPKLVTVRFIDLTRRKLRALRTDCCFRQYWKEWVDDLSYSGIKIEDSRGEIIDH